tara:strand:+ start:40 stop:195 length:156 start_codon:yes stop_codon:yes gene_type:complete
VVEMLIKPVYFGMVIAAGGTHKADPWGRYRVAKAKSIKVWMAVMGKTATAN